MELTQLSYGRFYGAPDNCIEVPGFSASLMTATTPLEDVPVHCHSSASIIYVLSGRYRSTADGIRRRCDSGTLISIQVGPYTAIALRSQEGSSWQSRLRKIRPGSSIKCKACLPTPSPLPQANRFRSRPHYAEAVVRLDLRTFAILKRPVGISSPPWLEPSFGRSMNLLVG